MHVSRGFFVADLAGIKSYVPALLGAIGAVAIVTVDTIVWLSICFALAGPMMLSGLYEALLDNRVIEFVREKTHNRNLTLDMRCRLLMVVLIGNLDPAVDDDPLVRIQDAKRTAGRRPASCFPVLEGVARSPESTSGSSTQDAESQASGHVSTKPGQDAGQEFGSLEPAKDQVDIHLNNLGDRADPHAGLGTNGLGLYGNHGPEQGTHDQVTTTVSSSGSAIQTQHGTPPIPEPNGIALADTDAPVIQRRSTMQFKPSPWRHMEELLYPIRLYDDGTPGRHLSPRQYPQQRHRGMPDGSCADRTTCTRRDHLETERPHRRTPKVARQVRKTQTRLRTMLNCQYSFGSMVGAPVLFFLGGFVFALLQSLEDLGSEDIAMALAFGQFYMTVPHIAIVSGLLLAGNNPNILEGVFATQRPGPNDEAERPSRRWLGLGLKFGLAYPSCYKVAWQWHRGHNKRRWIDLLIDTYGQRLSSEERARVSGRGGVYDDNLADLETLRERTTPSPLDWFLVLSMTGLLLGTPIVLGFITAYYTPEVGLSCRSFTFLCYAVSQIGQIVLWLWQVSIWS